MVSSGEFGLLVWNEAGRSKVLATLNAMLGRILILAEVTLNHPVDVFSVGPG